MKPLFEKLRNDALAWRNSGYGNTDFPLIGEILAWQMEEQLTESESHLTLKFLREPQFLALEVYWYVRLRLKTRRTIDLYKECYPDDKKTFFDALGVPLSEDALKFAEIDKVLEEIKTDEAFVKEKKIQALHEAIMLDYPSYILALAMGAGKTVLIGAIIATEFAMSLRYSASPNKQINFMKNALVFAPGTTIIESLRELSRMPFEKILPPYLNSDFLANLKIDYPGSGKDIQAQTGSSYNLIVTNTEKISLRAFAPMRRRNQSELNFECKKAQEKLKANLRLQKITSLPNLGIFSDEAHHTYGNTTFDKIKRVRETINYIHEKTPILVVVNTTGTPYYKKQSLKEVIFWYGLKEGIEDNILKSLTNGIHQYNIQNQEKAEKAVFNNIIEEFFKHYGNVALTDGAKAKIAFYFKTQVHLNDSRKFIEEAMIRIGQSDSQILVNTQTSKKAEINEFNRLNDPGNQKRVILLIGKGVEGWNCPSLFACALIKEQTSKNHVLQAATRCLRQVPGNTHSAKIFLDEGNTNILNRQLQENFNENLDDLRFATEDKQTIIVRILKTELPKLEITRTVKKVVEKGTPKENIRLEKPKAHKPPATLLNILTPDFSGPREILMPTGDTKELSLEERIVDCHTAACKIAACYHLSVMPILKRLKALYPQGEMPNSDLYGLFRQVEKQQVNYEIIEEKITEAMALIRLRDDKGNELFEKDENGMLIHHLHLLKRTVERMDKAGLFAKRKDYQGKHNLSFHYEPYNFDSRPERSLFDQVLSLLNKDPDDVQAFLFTGGLTDPKKTTFILNT